MSASVRRQLAQQKKNQEDLKDNAAEKTLEELQAEIESFKKKFSNDAEKVKEFELCDEAVRDNIEEYCFDRYLELWDTAKSFAVKNIGQLKAERKARMLKMQEITRIQEEAFASANSVPLNNSPQVNHNLMHMGPAPAMQMAPAPVPAPGSYGMNFDQMQQMMLMMQQQLQQIQQSPQIQPNSTQTQQFTSDKAAK
jgi:hypothetical protein